MKALVVDDVGYSRLIVQKSLEKMGFDVVQASSGAEALRLLREEPSIDLVVSDLMMPEMDGIELIGEARKLEPPSEYETGFPPPFVMLTASPKQSLLVKAKKAGFIEIMVKPLDQERFRRTIEMCLADKTDGAVTKMVDYDDVVKSVKTTVGTVIKKQDQDAARKIRDRLQAEIVKIDAYLEKHAGEKKA